MLFNIYIHDLPTSDNIQKAWLCRWSGYHAASTNIEGIERRPQSGYGHLGWLGYLAELLQLASNGRLPPLSLAWKAQKYYWHILHNTTTKACLQADFSEDQSTNTWLAASWEQEWESAGPTRIHNYIWDLGDGIEGEDLPCRQWTLLNRLPTGVSCFKSSVKKWALADSATCKCGELRRLLTI